MYECLGFKLLGLCGYNPTNPAIYFSVGDAIAALSIALVLPQFLKPIFVFRLSSRWLSLRKLYTLVFLATALVVFSAVLPSLPGERSTLLDYPVFWEVLAAALFLVTYAALALAVIQPTRVRVTNAVRYVRSAARLLSEANSRDHVDFAQDLRANFVEIVRLASFDEWARDRTAFYEFTHQAELEAAAYSRSLLSLVADDAFCASLVIHSPWIAAQMVNNLGAAKVSRRAASPFIQGLARHAIFDSASMMAREIEFGGFGVAPVLSDALFGHEEIIRACEPLHGIWLFKSPPLTGEILKRLNAATGKALETILASGHHWEAFDFFHVESIYQSAMLDVVLQIEKGRKDKAKIVDERLLSELTSGICDLIKAMRKSIAEMPSERRASFYAKNKKDHDHHIVEAIAELAYESLAGISNGFDSNHYPSWHFALEWMDSMFNRWHGEEVGMDPLQQRVAIKLLDKVRDNMKGRYPAISRPLIAVLDPLGQATNPGGAQPYRLLEEMLFHEWQGFRELAQQKPEKLKHFLPPNVRYDRKAHRFFHRYASGNEQAGTDFSRLHEPVPSLLCETSWRDRQPN